MNNQIKKYLKETWFNYKQDIGLPEPYTYLYGNPIKVHVPVDLGIGGLMIVGAYPTAHFNTLKALDGMLLTDVPVEDHLYPFSNEIYFDGSRINTVKSGKEIEEYFLENLKVKREDCWITDLVKVFLFRQGHIDKYNNLGYAGFKANRNDFMDYAKQSLAYLWKEIDLAQPRVVVCLGEEVNAAVHGVSQKKANALLTNKPIYKTVNGKDLPFFACPHPGILMRKGAAGEKWRAVLNETLTEIKKYI